ncbi:MAG: efflux RND transporter periplasmic adaptor subunit [Labilibaculum sp.]|nr:efflux RND transporter periplasmic adaptor subunit [Labilibaculum sp.]
MKQMRFYIVFSLLVSISIGIISCQSGNNRKKLLQPVKVFKTKINNLNETKILTGIVKEFREVELAFQVSGPLVKLNVQTGQYVRKGELIAEISDRDYIVKLESTNANYENAKLQAERYATLYTKKSTSKSIHDQMQANLKLAKAKNEVAENALNDTKLYAPFTGYIQTKFVENYQKVTLGQPIISLLDLSKLELCVALSENDFLQNKSFVSYRCEFEAIPSVEFKLNMIEIEKKTNGDNFFNMRLRLNPENKQILPGMTANVKIECQSNDSKIIKIPGHAVCNNGSKTFVWTINESTNSVKQKQVKLSGFDSKGMVKITKGLKEGDLVVVAGMQSLRNGQNVKILKEKSNTNIGGQL